jgi:LDH2 family malate/lactate/ureidoglycolate dehydrogenase
VVLERVKNAERQPGVDEILLPGERGDRVAAANIEVGALSPPQPTRSNPG